VSICLVVIDELVEILETKARQISLIYMTIADKGVHLIKKTLISVGTYLLVKKTSDSDTYLFFFISNNGHAQIDVGFKSC
jgi:hypothetical protein